MSDYYHKKYFDSIIFDYDYAPIAQAILDEYHPKTIIEFGCGNGELSKALAGAGLVVTALDGYSTPDFSGFDSIEFQKVDLNNPAQAISFLTSMNKKFDVAVCMEVAEHLNPDVSQQLIELLTMSSDIIIFSAAVINQDGDGHINCRSRIFWHEIFEQRGFFAADTIRQKIRENDKVGKWYRLNTIDYVKFSDQQKIKYNEVIKRLVASESESSSSYYNVEKRLQQMQRIFNFGLIKTVFNFRNSIKKLLGKKPVPLP